MIFESFLQSLISLSPMTPLLIIHGENDEIIPVKHGKTLYHSFEADTSLKVNYKIISMNHKYYS